VAREGMTNAGKKEQRQVNRLIDKQAKEGPQSSTRPAEGRLAPRGHSTRKGQKGAK
jgi:hypothetical protein